MCDGNCSQLCLGNGKHEHSPASFHEIPVFHTKAKYAECCVNTLDELLDVLGTSIYGAIILSTQRCCAPLFPITTSSPVFFRKYLVTLQMQCRRSGHLLVIGIFRSNAWWRGWSKRASFRAQRGCFSSYGRRSQYGHGRILPFDDVGPSHSSNLWCAIWSPVRCKTTFTDIPLASTSESSDGTASSPVLVIMARRFSFVSSDTAITYLTLAAKYYTFGRIVSHHGRKFGLIAQCVQNAGRCGQICVQNVGRCGHKLFHLAMVVSSPCTHPAGDSSHCAWQDHHFQG